MAEKLKLQTNVPVDIALKFDEGKPFNGEYGDSVMYTLTDDRVWFAPPIVAQKITALGIAKGELFRIVKAEITKGNRRTVEYQVSRLEAEPADATGVANQNAPQLVPPGPTPATPVSRGRELAVEQLRRAFEVSIDALIASREYAHTKSLDLKFNEQNIISVAMSVYINATREAKTWAA